MFRKLFTWCLYGALMGLCILGFLGLFVAVADAQDVIPDVKATIIGTSFQCHIGLEEAVGATSVPTKSVSLFEEFDLVQNVICVTLPPGALDIHVAFDRPYNPTRRPLMRAMAFSEAGCGGLRSTASVNGCEVEHTVSTPIVLSPDHPDTRTP